ncbi:MAG TPA: ion transporter [Burkholderiales bacterium]|nr:ion transporter [Burkholderiales bacterium]
MYLQLDPSARSSQGLSLLNRFICGLIIASIAFAILETEPTLTDSYDDLFSVFERMLTAAFIVEYVARLWICVENPLYAGGWGRLRYAYSPIAIIDLIALTPALLSIAGSGTFVLRLFRLVRILRLARLGHFSQAMKHIGAAVNSRRHELMLSGCMALLLLIVSSVLLYLIEGSVQPKEFGSIPRAMWWAIATLTTVGYGDVFPITALGRVVAGITAVFGIGLIALPTGILAAAFGDAMQRNRPSGEK